MTANSAITNNELTALHQRLCTRVPPDVCRRVPHLQGTIMALAYLRGEVDMAFVEWAGNYNYTPTVQEVLTRAMRKA